MKAISIDSLNHYAFRLTEDKNAVNVLEFASDCPYMGHRGSYTDAEGKVKYTLYIGEKVIVNKHQEHIPVIIKRELASNVDADIVCGDNLLFRLK